MTQPTFMIYGAYGYTGELIARQAVAEPDTSDAPSAGVFHARWATRRGHAPVAKGPEVR